MGDNNNVVDQSCYYISRLVKDEDIVSVPIFEIPWLGCVKMIVKGDLDTVKKYAPNSIPNLMIVIFTGIMSFISLFTLYMVQYMRKR